MFLALVPSNIGIPNNNYCNISYGAVDLETVVPPTSFKNYSAFMLSKFATISSSFLNADRPSVLSSTKNIMFATDSPVTIAGV